MLSKVARALAASIVAGGGAWLFVAPPARAASPVAVAIAGFAYAPNPLNVHIGDTVTWTNRDTAPHTVTTASGPAKLASPDLARGQTWTYTFSTAGTYKYYCAVHPNMRATVVVTAAVAAAPVPAARPSPSVQTAAVPAAGAPAPAALVTTSTTTSPGGAHINPLLFLLAVVAGVVVIAVLASLSGDRPGAPG